MYRLLIVSKDPRVEDMFASLDGWETMGFKQPRLRTTVEDAIACMQKHHVDAIAVEQSPEFDELIAYLDQAYPALPIFHIEKSADEQLATLKEVYQLLNQLHFDHSNDDYDEAYYFKLAREHWMKMLLSGMVSSPVKVLINHRLFRCVESVDAPCIYARLSVPSGDSFLTGRWHYGSERLEIALRNFFGNDHEKMLVHIAVVAPEEVRVLACPKPEYTHSASFGADHVLGFIEETIDQIEQYLGLKMNVVDIRKLENITAFATDF